MPHTGTGTWYPIQKNVTQSVASFILALADENFSDVFYRILDLWCLCSPISCCVVSIYLVGTSLRFGKIVICGHFWTLEHRHCTWIFLFWPPSNFWTQKVSIPVLDLPALLRGFENLIGLEFPRIFILGSQHDMAIVKAAYPRSLSSSSITFHVLGRRGHATWAIGSHPHKFLSQDGIDRISCGTLWLSKRNYGKTNVQR